jgi:5,5'-dehydrodivanillate O-demethylase
MLSREENDYLTRIGPGTPAGNFLRRYWHPVAVAAELHDKPVKRVRILGEDLVLYRGQEGGYGLVEERCSHRGASLFYAKIEGDNIRCVYHGWLFSPVGKCLDQPAEPEESTFKDRVRHPGYRVEKLAGLLYAYMGPEPAPLLPRYDVLVRKDGIRKIQVHPLLDCNWLQPMENSVDPTHSTYLHFGGTGKPIHGDGKQTIAKHDFEVFEHGIMKKRYAKTGSGELEIVNAHPLVFPNMLRQRHGPRHYLEYRVPIDDTHTAITQVYFTESSDGADVDQPEDPPLEFVPPYKSDDGVHRMDKVMMQDYMAWETAGPIYDRTREQLGAADRGIILYRKLLKEQIDKVAAGEDPIGIIRDALANRLIQFETVTDSSGAPESLVTRIDTSGLSGKTLI